MQIFWHRFSRKCCKSKRQMGWKARCLWCAQISNTSMCVTLWFLCRSKTASSAEVLRGYVSKKVIWSFVSPKFSIFAYASLFCLGGFCLKPYGSFLAMWTFWFALVVITCDDRHLRIFKFINPFDGPSGHETSVNEFLPKVFLLSGLVHRIGSMEW